MRVVFMGTSAFAVPALEKLYGVPGVSIPAVYTQPPRQSGRGHQVKKTDVHSAAEVLGLAVRCPENLGSPSQVVALEELAPDLVLVASYGLLLPQVILDVPKSGCVNIHGSTLPRWRGASPIQQAILHGDPSTGVDFFQMEAGLDTGPILWRRETAIGEAETAGDLHNRLAQIAASAVPDFLSAMAADTLSPTPQPQVGITYAPRIDKRDGDIDWHRSAVEIERQIRAFHPWPGAWTSLGEERLRLLVACVEPAASDAAGVEPGIVIGSPLRISTSDGLLVVQRVQRAGRKPLAVGDLLRGFPIALGSRLGL